MFAMFMDNDDAFLSSLMEVTHRELGTEEFVVDAYEYVRTKYPMSEQDMIDYRTGTLAFLECVKRGRVLMVSHLLKPQSFGLPIRHKSSVLTLDKSV